MRERRLYLCAWWATVHVCHWGPKSTPGEAGRENGAGGTVEGIWGLPASIWQNPCLSSDPSPLPAEVSGCTAGVEGCDWQVAAAAPPLIYRALKGWALFLWPCWPWLKAFSSGAEKCMVRGWFRGLKPFIQHTYTHPIVAWEDTARRHSAVMEMHTYKDRKSHVHANYGNLHEIAWIRQKLQPHQCSP